ncbi:hypothetical protein [Pseudoxanthomonas kalamensis]|uniref:hypothetical protein n=1 Tax=Pseudoxanthomonas kalamensis TaxID=289483 RepID=UPI0013911F66|nr:hypothetical protein [Pseudoxanthomonas kalamensis]
MNLKLAFPLAGHFRREAKPTYFSMTVRLRNLVVVRFVAMTRLTCFRSKVLLGRNLITLFSSVNTFPKFFSTSAGTIGKPRVGIRRPSIRPFASNACASIDREKRKAHFSRCFFAS